MLPILASYYWAQMASSRGFASGLLDFLLAPLRLWHMHNRLIQLNPGEKHLRNVQKHRLEHARRMQLREKMRESGYSSHAPSPPISTPTDLVDSDGLFQPLVRMWLINVGLILLLAIPSYTISFFHAQEYQTHWMTTFTVFTVLSRIVSGVLHFGLPLFMELVNTLYLKKICDRISLLREDTSRELPPTFEASTTAISPLGATIMDRVYALIFFLLFQVQWTVICSLSSSFRISQVIKIFSVAFMYACYAIEYRWRQVPGRTFEGFLVHILDHWTYFIGYGFFVGLGYERWPDFIGCGGMFLAFTYPILVIGALSSHHPTRSTNHDRVIWLEEKLSRLFRFPLVLSMHPALFFTNLIVRGCVGVAYQLWF
ncbi:unnamed protein product [Dicrocoelium dendriticum]|nr:unnamed protein product [Dicrocoelium dendriticum]